MVDWMEWFIIFMGYLQWQGVIVWCGGVGVDFLVFFWDECFNFMFMFYYQVDCDGLYVFGRKIMGDFFLQQW